MLTENTQPALMAVSVAVVRILERDGRKPLTSLASHVAGHSLGEYSALVAAGALELADGARLVKLRGQSMQKAVPVGEGAMAALLGIELGPAQEACKERHKAKWSPSPTTMRRPDRGQRPQGGRRARDRDRQAARLQARILLPVSAPFHCP